MAFISIPIPRIRRRKPRLPEPGAAPGTLVAAPGLPKPVVQRFVYNSDGCDSSDVDPANLEEALSPVPGSVVWIDVQGLGDLELIRLIGSALALHPLTVEDIVHVHQRPKEEEFDDYLFIVQRAIRLLDDQRVDNEQLSFVLKQGILVTFQERHGDVFDPVRRRIREGKGFIRKNGADYLLYALIDGTIDNYYPVLDLYGESMEQLDEQVREKPTTEASKAIHSMRRELRQFRRAVWPLREVTGSLGRGESSFVDEATRSSFRDCHDHVIQVADFLEGNRERVSDLADLYVAMMGEKTNQVMKVLTIIATIFIPLTFLCGLYGMNFDTEVSPWNMPELKWKYGYPAFWIVTAGIFLFMLWFFRRKGWIGKKS